METIFDWSIRVSRIHFQAIHRDIFENSKRFSWGFIAMLAFNVIMLSGCCYTIWNYDTGAKFNAALLFAAITQAFIRYLFMDDLCAMIDVVKDISEIHKKNSFKAARDYKLCEKYAYLAKWISIGIPTIYSILIILYQFPAFLDILTNGTILPSLGVYLPGASESDTIDMSVLLFTNIILSIFDIGILSASDIFIYINFSTIPMFSTIIQRQINDFNNTLKDKKKMNNSKLIKKQLIDIIKMQLTYNENIEKIEKAFNRTCFAQIATSFFFTVFSIFVITKFHQGRAIASAFTGILQILLLCLMGTIVEISSTNLLNKINAFDWYLLPHRHIRDYQVWLHYSQQPKILYIAKIKPLNMETSVSICRAIYSYATVLYSLV